MNNNNNTSVYFTTRIINFLIIASAFVFFIITIKYGHKWGGDFAQYISHGINIATGKSYIDTGYFFNQYSGWYGPKTYPPVFPYLLSLVYQFNGLNLYAMKIMIIVCFAIFLFIYNIYCAKRVENNLTVTFALIMIAFSPAFWETKNNILSDIPFIMFLYLALLMAERIDRIQKDDHKAILEAFIFGLVCYLAYGTRSVGLLVIVAFCFSQMYRRRKITSAMCTYVVVFSLLFIWQNAFLHSDASYLENINNDQGIKKAQDSSNYIEILYGYGQFVVNNITNHVPQYAKVLKWFWEGGSNPLIGIYMTIITVIISMYGYITLLARRASTGEIFTLIYTSVLIFGPFFQGMRYLIPILPMYSLCLFNAVDQQCLFPTEKAKKIIKIGFISIILMIYLMNYLRLDYSPYKSGIGKKTTVELFNYIEQNTPKDSLIIFQKPRVLALFARRRSSTYFSSYDEKFDGKRTLEFFKKINATHVIISNGVWGHEEVKAYVKWVKAEQSILIPQYINQDFTLYSIHQTK